MLYAFVSEKDKPFESNVSRARMLAAIKNPNALLWVDLENADEFETDALVEIFNFHPLAVEDCVTDVSSPKVDDYDDHLFIVMHAVSRSGDELLTTELDVFVGRNYVVTFHRTPVRSVEQVREQIKKKNSFFMGRDATLLFHALLDRLVDNYMPVLDQYDAGLDELEDLVFEAQDERHLPRLLRIKHDLSMLRRTVAPQRDMIYYLTRNASDFITDEQKVYFRDVYDHLFRIYGITEGFHEKIGILMQVHFSVMSNKMNLMMKRMTAMATLTMPSLIIASIYGMNFQHMPELDHPLGYFFSLGLMAFAGVGMLIWMKWKKWI